MTAPNLGRYDQSDLLELAQEVAEAAGKLLRTGLESVAGGLLLATGASSKSSPTDLVTDVDRASEALIVSSLLRARPDDGILGEEGSSRKGSTGVTWVIDPLDGTINYLYGIEEFAVSIGASVDGRSIVGAVHNPVNGEMFAACEGQGATLNGRELRLKPSGRPLAEALGRHRFHLQGEGPGRSGTDSRDGPAPSTGHQTSRLGINRHMRSGLRTLRRLLRGVAQTVGPRSGRCHRARSRGHCHRDRRAGRRVLDRRGCGAGLGRPARRAAREHSLEPRSPARRPGDARRLMLAG